MADDQEQKIKLTFDTNAKDAAKDVNKLDKSVNKTVDTQKKSAKATKETNNSLESLGGGIGSAISGFKGLIKQMWLLVANPVGAIIAAVAVALVGLYKAFTSTKAGGEKLEQVMDGIGAVMDVLRDRVLKIGSALIKFFTGDFKGAIEDGKAAVNGFGDEVAEEFKKAAAARKSLQEVADAMRELGVQRAKLNRDLVQAKEIIDDENASYGDKVKAIEAVTKAEEEQTAKELSAAKKKLEAIKQQNALSDSSSEALQAEADAEAALYQLQEQSARDRIKNQKLKKKADNEEQARIKELNATRKAAAMEAAKLDAEERKRIEDLAKLKLTEEEKALRAIQDLNDKTEEEKLARQKERALAEIERLEQQGVDVRNMLVYNDELYATLEQELRDKRDAEALEAKKKQAEEEAKIDEAILKQKEAVEASKQNLLDSGINFLKAIAGKSKILQKGIILAESALGIGRSIISTQTANAAATAEGAALAIPTAGASVAAAAGIVTANNISTGLGIAANIAATAKAMQALGGGSAGSAPNIGGGGPSGSSAAPQVGFQASSENQIATSITQSQEDRQPLEAFMVESQATTTQNLARKRQANSSF